MRGRLGRPRFGCGGTRGQRPTKQTGAGRRRARGAGQGWAPTGGEDGRGSPKAGSEKKSHPHRQKMKKLWLGGRPRGWASRRDTGSCEARAGWLSGEGKSARWRALRARPGAVRWRAPWRACRARRARMQHMCSRASRRRRRGEYQSGFKVRAGRWSGRMATGDSQQAACTSRSDAKSSALKDLALVLTLPPSSCRASCSQRLAGERPASRSEEAASAEARAPKARGQAASGGCTGLQRACGRAAP